MFELIEPSGPLSAQSSSEIRIRLNASDNEALAYVQVMVLDPGTGDIISLETIGLGDETGGPESWSLDEFVKVGTLYTPTGTYKLAVDVFDLAGNGTRQLIDLHLDEVPLKLNKAFFSTREAGGAYTLRWLDTLGQLQSGSSFPDEILLTANGFNNALLLAEKRNGGKVHILDGSDASEVALIDFQVPGNLPAIGGMDAELSSPLQIAHLPNREIRSFTFMGTSTGIWPLVHDPLFIDYEDRKLYVLMKHLSQPQWVVQAYTGDGITFLGSAFLQQPLQWLTAKDDAFIYAFGNQNGIGNIIQLDKNSLDSLGHIVLTDSITSVFPTLAATWVLTQNGLRRLDHNTFVLESPLLSGSWTAVGYDEAENRIFLGKQDEITLWNTSGSLIDTYSGVLGTAAQFSFLYNK